MTVGGIILCVSLTLIFAICIVYGFACIIDDGDMLKGLSIIIIFIVGIVGVWIGGNWYYNHTERGKRAMKSQESNFNGGITREVNVYDMNGDVIVTYRGKFDVEHDADKVLFDDESGKRHIIYYTTGTITVDEISEELEK